MTNSGANSQSVYVDGVLNGSGTMSEPEHATGQRIRLGWSWGQDGNIPYNGLMDEVYFYNTTVTATQAAHLATDAPPFSQLPSTTTVTINNGGTLDLNSARATIASLSGSAASTVALGNGVLTVGDTTNSTFAGAVTGTGTLLKTGSGTLSLTGASTHTGSTVVNGGTLSGTAALTSPITVNNGGVLAGTISSASTLQVNAGGRVSPGGDGSINTMNVAGNATFAAGAVFSCDISAVDTTCDRLTSSGNIVFTRPTHLDIAGSPAADTTYIFSSTTGTSAGAINNVSVRNFPAAKSISLSQVAKNNQIFVSTPAARSWTGLSATSNNWSDPANWSGNYVPMAGPETITLGDGGPQVPVNLDINVSLGALTLSRTTQAVTIAAGGGTLSVTGVTAASSQNHTINSPMFLRGATNFDVPAAVTLSVLGGMTGDATSALSKSGAGTLALSGANTYAGATTVDGGTLRVLSLAPAGFVAHYSFDNIAGNTVVNGGSLGAALNGTIAGGATIAAGQGRGGGNALSMPANFAASVEINTAGVAALTNWSTSTPWTVAGWIKTTTNGGAFIAKGNPTIGWGGQIGQTLFYLNSGSGAGNRMGYVRNAGGWVTGQTPMNDGQWHHFVITNIANTQKVYLDGVDNNSTPNMNLAEKTNTPQSQIIRLGWGWADAGSFAMDGMLDEIYFYQTNMSAAQAAALYLSSGASPLPSTTAVTVNSGTFDVSGINTTVASISGAAGTQVLLNGALLTLTGANSTAYQGVISGTGGVLKSGTGTLTLTGANTYTGTTQVNGGTLNGSGSLASALTVGSGGVLSGTLTTSGALTVSAGGRVSPGGDGTIGTLTVNNTVSFAANSIFTCDVSTVDATSDKVLSNNNITFTRPVLMDVSGSPAADTTYIWSSTTGSTAGTISNMTLRTYPAGKAVSLSQAAKDNQVFIGTPGTRTWTGASAASNNWSDPANWAGNFVPMVGGDSVVIGDGGAQIPVNLDCDVSLATLTLSRTAPQAVNISAGGGTMAFTSVVASGLNHNLRAPMSLNGTVVFDVAGSANLSVLGGITGTASAAVTKNGAGTMTVGGFNSYPGATTINGGTMLLTPLLYIPTGTAAYYTFDNVVGSTVVNNGSAGTALNGTIAGGATIAVGQGRNGGNALSMPGNFGAYVEVNTAAAAGLTDWSTATPWTVAGWIKTTTNGGAFISKGNPNTVWAGQIGQTLFYLNSGSGAGNRMGYVRNAGGWVTGQTPVTDGQWHHFVITNVANTQKVYLDGVDNLSTPNMNLAERTSPAQSQIIRLGWGWSDAGASAMNGMLDEIYFMQTNVTAAQAAELYSTQVPSTLPATTALVLNSGELNLGNVKATVGSLSGAAGSTLTLGTGTLTAGDSTSTMFAGTITGNGTLTKVGTGTLTLSGASPAFNGTANVNAGTLNGNGSTASSVIVNNSATIAGALITGALTVNAGGRVSPGGDGTIGTLSATTATFAANSIFTGDLPSVGTVGDLLACSGNITFSKPVLFDIAGTPGNNTFTWSSTTGASGGSLASVNVRTFPPGKSVAMSQTAGSPILNQVIIGTPTTRTWNGESTTSSNWSDGANWTGGIAPLIGDNVVIGNNTGAGGNRAPVNLDRDVSIGTLTLNRTSSPVAVAAGGGQLTLGGNLSASGGDHSITAPVFLQGSIAFDTGATTLTVNGGTGGDAASALVKNGSGLLLLGGNNTYAGSTTINAGTLRIGTVPQVPLGYTAYYSFDNMAGNTVVNGGSTGAALNGTVVNPQAATIAVGQGRNGGNALSLTGTNTTFVDINTGNVAGLTNFSPTSNWTFGLWIRTSTATTTMLYKGDLAWNMGNTRFYLNNGNGGGGGTRMGLVRHSGGWVTGTTNVNTGVWKHVMVVNDAALPSNKQRIYVDGVSDGTGNMTLAESSTNQRMRLGWTEGNDSSVAYNGLMDEVYIYNTALNASQAMQLFTGIAGGTLPATTSVIIADDATLDFNNFVQSIASVADAPGVTTRTGRVLLGSGSISLTSNSNASFSGVISGTGTLTKAGTGTQALNGANTYSGGTVLNAGTLSTNTLADAGASGIGNTGSVTFNGGALQYTGAGAASSARTFVINTTGGVDVQSAAANLTLSGSVGTIANTTLNKSGAGTLTLSGATDNFGLLLNALAGNTILAKASTAAVHAVSRVSGVSGGAAVTLGGTGGDQILNSSLGVQSMHGTFDLAGTTEAIDQLTGTGIVTSTANAALTICQNGSTFTFDGSIQNAIALTKVNGGNATLTGTSTFTRGTILSGGTLTLANSGGNTLPDNGSVAMALATTLALSNVSDIVGTLSSAGGGISLGTGTLTTTVTSDVTIAGVISGAGSLVKAGPNTHILSAANTYSGTTTVAAGALRVTNGSGSGTGTGTVSVQSGGTFTGNGIVNGPVIVASGGNYEPGTAGAGKITTGALTLGPGSIAAFQLRTPDNGVANSGADDEAQVNGNITLSGTLIGTDLGGLNFGTYRLFTFTGTRIGDFTTITMPAGFGARTDFGTAGAVNLIVNRAPVGTTPAQTVAEFATFSFQCTASDEPGQTMTYSLEPGFPPGTTITPSGMVTHTAAQDGPSSASLVVRITDNGVPALSSTQSIVINVTNANPGAVLGNGGAVSEGSTGTVSFSGQTDPSSVDITAGFRYSYDFNNDSTFETGGNSYATALLSATETVPALYLDDNPSRVVHARVWDKDGGFADYTTTIPIDNVAPTATLANSGDVLEGAASATVTVENQFDPSTTDSVSLRYSYDYDNDGNFDAGDGTWLGSLAAASATIPPAYFSDGPLARVVRARIIDKDGGLNDYLTAINVANVPPTGAIGAIADVNEGSPAAIVMSAQFDVSPQDVNAGFKYSYDFNYDGVAPQFDLGGVSYAAADTNGTPVIPAGYSLLALNPARAASALCLLF